MANVDGNIKTIVFELFLQFLPPVFTPLWLDLCIVCSIVCSFNVLMTLTFYLSFSLSIPSVGDGGGEREVGALYR